MNTTEIPQALAKLVSLAQTLIDKDETTAAAYMLAFVMRHPHTSALLYAQAEALFDDLEATICPRVIWDAREWANTADFSGVNALLSAQNLPNC